MFKHLLRKLGLPIYKLIYYRIKWRNKCHIFYSAYVYKNSSFEGMSRIHANTTFIGHLGFGSYIGANCNISAEIGKFTSIASHVECISGRHPMEYPFVSTSPLFYSLIPNNVKKGLTFATRNLFTEHKYAVPDKKLSVKIGSDCWIGQGVKIISGVTIGDGAVVLAGAIVTKDVPPYSVVGGTPAKLLRYRYSEEVISFLKGVRWWNQSNDWFKDNWELMCNFEKFKAYFIK